MAVCTTKGSTYPSNREVTDRMSSPTRKDLQQPLNGVDSKKERGQLERSIHGRLNRYPIPQTVSMESPRAFQFAAQAEHGIIHRSVAGNIGSSPDGLQTGNSG